MKTLSQYIIALTNFYGAVHKNEVVEIYNSQNTDSITLQNVEEYLKCPPEELKKNFSYPEGDYFILNAFFDDEQVEDLLKQKQDRPYYVPEKQELLKYADHCYMEKTLAYKKFHRYMTEHVLDGNKKEAEGVCDDVYLGAQMGNSLLEIFYSFDRMRVYLKDQQQVDEVAELIVNLANHTRRWELNGHTPHEMQEKYGRREWIMRQDKRIMMRQTVEE